MSSTDGKLTNAFMKKHLVKYNKFARDDLMVRGLGKMIHRELEKEFFQRFKLFKGASGRVGYVPKTISGFSVVSTNGSPSSK